MIDVGTVKGRIQAFHQRHGAECYQVEGWYYYPDGARREVEPLGALIEPPAANDQRSEYELRLNIVKHYEAKLDRAVSKFEELREHLRFCRPNDGGKAAMQELKQLRSIVEARQEELRKAQAALDATYIGRMRKNREQKQQEETTKWEEWREELRELRI